MVVLELLVVVCEPPPGIGVVLVLLCDVVVDGGVDGVAGVVTVVLVEDDEAGGVVVVGCANEIGMASARLMQSALAARRAFMTVPPGPRAGPCGLTPCRRTWLPPYRSAHLAPRAQMLERGASSSDNV